MYYVLEYKGSFGDTQYEASSGFGSKRDMLSTLGTLLSSGIYQIDVRAYEDEFTTKEER